MKEYALAKAGSRLTWLESQLTGCDTLFARFSVADAYLVTVLSWIAAVPVTLGPETQRYLDTLRERPSVARSLCTEYALHAAGSGEHT